LWTYIIGENIFEGDLIMDYANPTPEEKRKLSNAYLGKLRRFTSDTNEPYMVIDEKLCVGYDKIRDRFKELVPDVKDNDFEVVMDLISIFYWDEIVKILTDIRDGVYDGDG